jgi:hypothetical protein
MVEEFGRIHRAIVMRRAPFYYPRTADANTAVKMNRGCIV